MPNRISIRIDGELVQAQPGQTILEAAHENGRFIPGLCQFKGLSTVGACRLCVVEVQGVNRLQPACTTPAQDGMAVITRSARLNDYRKQALELLFAEKNHVCAVCVSNNHCELQAYAQRLGVTNVRYAYRYPRLPLDMSHPRFVIDHNRCVVCTRCVRVCNEVEGAYVWGVAGRGIGSRIACEMDREWGKAGACTNCGKCVQVCPTGALAEKGFAAEEMIKRHDLVERLATIRGVMNPGGAR